MMYILMPELIPSDLISIFNALKVFVMNNKFLYIIISAFFLTVSCKKQLEDKLYDKLAPANYFQNDGEAISAANAIYGALNGTGWDYYGAGNERIQMLSDATTDEFAA